MAGRVLRIIASFVVVFGGYWIYALLMVPLIEPRIEIRPRRQATQEEIAEAGKIGQRNSDLLKELFPPGAWERNDDVKVLETEQAKLLVKSYDPLENGQVRLLPCTVLYYPSEKVNGVEQRRARPVILRAEQGAILQFDRAVDLRQARFGGDFVGGNLVGPVVIHSDESRPGANDELEIVTRDVQLLNQRISTVHPVQFRMGPNHGKGREMTITMASAPSGKSDRHGAALGGVQTFELLHDVTLHLELGGARMPLSSQPAALAGKPAPSQPPVEVTCRGPFRYDVSGQVASFADQVDVHQLHPNGQSDQLSCEALSIRFARKGDPAPAAGVVPASASMPLSGAAAGVSLRARFIEASGDPVIIRSPGRGADARCQTLKYDVETQRITLEGNRDVQLHQESNDIRARRLDYQMATPGRLGQVFASGPGRLEGAARQNPSQVYRAQWTEHLTLRPEQDKQLLSLVGNASMQYTDVGRLAGDSIHFWFTETADGPARRAQSRAAGAKRLPAAGMTPDRMLAVGKVSVDSQSLLANTSRLDVRFRPAAANQAANPGAALPGNTRSDDADRPPVARQAKEPARKFDVGGNTVNVEVAMGESRQDVAGVSIEGNARLQEVKTANDAAAPLSARGDLLRVSDADTTQKKLIVAGKPAVIEAQGMSLSGAQIELEQSTNRMWVNGAGRMTLPPSKPKPGQAFDPGALEVLWQGLMRFDGQTASYERNVVAQGTNMLLRTERLDVSLNRRVDFGNPPDRGQRTETDVAGLICSGGAVFDNRSFEAGVQKSLDHMETVDLSINRITGAINGHGPGQVTSVRYGSPETSLALPGQTPKPQPPLAASEPKLGYLNVRFSRTIGGNINRREIILGGDVEAVYGPVDTWEQKLSADDPESLGPKGALLKCDRLTAREIGTAKPGQPAPVELEAMGNASVDGTNFRALAQIIRYSREADRLALEGYPGNEAQLYRQTRPGAEPIKTTARKITFWRTLNQVNLEDVRFIDSGALPAATRKTAPPRR